jgi:hypothetical protein
MFRRAIHVASLLALTPMACSGDDTVRCTTSDDCLQGGIHGACTPSPASTDQWCAFPDPMCPGSAERWGIKSGDGLAGICLDMDPDAGPTDAGSHGGTPAFDVIYVDEWRQSYDVPMGTSMVIVNKSSSPLNLETLHVKFIDDDNPMVATIATMNHPGGVTLGLDEATGSLSDAARPLVTTLLDERIVDSTTDLLEMNLVAAGNTAYDLKVSLVVQLDGLDVPLPMTIHHVAGPATYGDPLHAVRVSVFR